MVENLYERLLSGTSPGAADVGIRIRARYVPAAGEGAKISPPTYPIEDRRSDSYLDPYLVEQRRLPDGTLRSTVLIDSRQSQANRCEEALQAAIDEERLWIPHLVLGGEIHGRKLRMTSLTAPHRSCDAYFLNAEDDAGTAFPDTTIGAELGGATAGNALALYRYAPTDLIYGIWDSHRGLRLAARFPRVYTSEVVGWDPQGGVRAAGRYDLLTSGAQKVSVTDSGRSWKIDPNGKSKLSELGLGSIPPSSRNRRGEPLPGGVSVSEIERLALLSFVGIGRIRLGEDREAAQTGRAVLAALAILGDRLAFGGSGLFLRSGCELARVDERIVWIRDGGEEEPLDVDAKTAYTLVEYAVARAEERGLAWHSEPVCLRPRANLQQAFDAAFFTAIGDEADT